jgi:hypothetical protein
LAPPTLSGSKVEFLVSYKKPNKKEKIEKQKKLK